MILTVTYNPAVDHTISIETEPRPGRVERATERRFDAGGKGINVSQYLAALGVETTTTGLLGGFTGEYVRDLLAAEPFDAPFVDVEDATRLNGTVHAADGEYKFNERGPSVDPDVVEDVLAVVTRELPDQVVVGGSLPPALGPDAIDRISRAGDWETAVDVGGELLARLEAHYACCKPNREELAAATGRSVDSVAEAIDAAEELRRMGYDRVVVSLGADGAALVSEDERLYAPPLQTTVRDTVGAGDALLSGVLAGFERGVSPKQALALGVAVASRAVATTGSGVPDLDDVDTLQNRVDVLDRSSEPP
ncbi:1-phosphofructokinase [Halorhabdus amylolytica]|uniref:1-phosphofructokinase n=1 Tax=Halorhabdus amylolytica TaxID=2559573 RepID=UPI0010AA6D2D|nr:1-phosphofructokinase [Halorhabdus amylolytica]